MPGIGPPRQRKIGRIAGGEDSVIQVDVVILEKGTEATGVGVGTQLPDTEWNPTPLYPPPWTLNSPMEPSENIPITVQPRLRSAAPPEPRPEPGANIMPDGPSHNELYGPRL
jgi:hypothetical protein